VERTANNGGESRRSLIPVIQLAPMRRQDAAAAEPRGRRGNRQT